MCEFCSDGPTSSRQNNGDSSDLRFAGFFSAEAIEAAVRQARINLDDIDDGASRSGSDDDEDGGEEDDDGT